LRAQHAELQEELLDGFSAVLASGRFILGDAVETFESDLAALCGARFGLGCNSGTDALWLALRGLGIGPGDAVLCPAFSFFATASAIVRVGARPVFADIHPATFNLDTRDAIRRAEQTPNLRAIISVDLFGRVCELGPLVSYCRKRDIHIIQDAAQSIDALDEMGRSIGFQSDIACFSFYPTKNLGALGDAGGLVTNDARLARSISRLRSHGESQSGLYEEVGLNSRMDALQAVGLSVKIRHLEGWTRSRRHLAAHYDSLFLEQGAVAADSDAEISAEHDLITHGAKLPILIPTPSRRLGRQTYHRYVIRVPANRRDELIRTLAHDSIESAVFYARGLHQQPALAEFAPSSSMPLRETERASQECLALPIFPELGIDRVNRVVAAVAACLSP
jgi:dTDP-4-amino-4,6-dideoxygalactose transaminase